MKTDKMLDSKEAR